MTNTAHLALRSLLLTACLCVPGPARADGDEVDTFIAALTGGSPKLDILYRLEAVDQDNDLRDATALNIRTRVGYGTAPYRGFSAYVELEDVRDAGSNSFNSTTNGQVDRSVVADPKGGELNQGYLRYSGLPGTTLTLGRQRLKVDNLRFVGNVGWRLNEQTYDAVWLTNESLPKTKLSYGFLANVNRIFGDDSPTGDFETQSHLLNAGVQLIPELRATGYAYFLDFEDTGPSGSLSTQTFGLRLSGATGIGAVKLLYSGEYANQSDFADGDSAIDADYYLIEPGLSFSGVTAKVGYEVLGGNGDFGFSTPLATLHAFQGWADVFLTTPPDGIRDLYVSVAAKVLGVKVVAAYHNFSADRGGDDYGDEFDLKISRGFFDHFRAGAGIAHYEAKDFGVDTDKIWAWVGFSI